jgi:hypothetical protein
MDALKLIPQLFFDAIARIIPGSAAILLFFFTVDSSWANWQRFMSGVLGAPCDKGYSSGFVVACLVLWAYLIGHLISPAVKVVEGIVDDFPPSIYQHPQGCDKKTQQKYKDNSSYNYDWLRLNKADVGALCAKVRAEFTMYNALVVVFFGFAPVIAWSKPLHWHIFIIGLAGLALLMAWRGRETHGTFLKMIDHFCEAAKGGPPH